MHVWVSVQTSCAQICASCGAGSVGRPRRSTVASVPRTATADRNWAFARAWLFKELRSDGPAEPGATGEDESGVTA